MSENEKRGRGTLLFNRVAFLVLGAFIAWGALSITTIRSARIENETLIAELDSVRYDAANLLDAAKVAFEAGDFGRAKESLVVLIDRHPGTSESLEGISVLEDVRGSEEAADQRWEAALPSIRDEWILNRTGELRRAAEATRAEIESSIDSQALQDWDNARDRIREEWDNPQR